MLAITYEHLPCDGGHGHLPYDGGYGRLPMWRLHGMSRKTMVREVNTLLTTYETSPNRRVVWAPFVYVFNTNGDVCY